MSLIRLIRLVTLSIFVLFASGIVLIPSSEARKRSRPKRQTKLPVTQKAEAKVEVIAEPRVAVSDNHSVLLDERPSVPGQLIAAISSRLRRDASPEEYLWACFSLRLKNSLSPGEQINSSDIKAINLTVSATGLGPAAFAIPDPNGCPGTNKTQNEPAQMCRVFTGSGRGWTNSFGCWQTVLTLPLDQGQNQQPKVVGVRIPVGLVQQPGSAVEGKIIIDDVLHKSIEVPLKIERPSDPINTGFQWFFGIAIPALLSFIIGYVALKVNTKFSSRTDELKSFTKFKDENYALLDAFFTNFYSGAYDANKANPKGLASTLRREMLNKKILSSIPQKERKRLEEALSLSQEKQIQERLGALFNEWRDSIEKQKTSN